jgi:hypothetical protein
MKSLKLAPLALEAGEVAVLAELMGDVQVATSAFYARTAKVSGVEALGTEVRVFLSAAQTLNERLGGSISDRGAYRSALSGTDAGQLLDAVKYVRNVSQHVLHVVRPAGDSIALVGGLHGLRLYACWDDVPAVAHAALHKRTQALRPAFEERLRGREVTGTMLETLGVLAALAPQIVHRDARGEWTGFPLETQAAMPGRLHPEEPTDLREAFAWLDSRPPNGDARVVAGQWTIEGVRYLLGYTVVGRRVPNAFIETSSQVDDDLATGFRYLLGDPAGHVKPRDQHGCQTHGSQVLMLVGDTTEWTVPLARTEWDVDWGIDPANPEWARVFRLSQVGNLPDTARYEVRRAQRLNA